MANRKLPTDIRVLASTIQKLVSEGMTQKQVAMHIGVTPDHLSRMKRAKVEIHQAIIKGRDEYMSNLPKIVQDSIIKQVQGYNYEEVEMIYKVQVADGEDVEVLVGKKVTKKYMKPSASVTMYAAKAILQEWDESEEIREEKTELQQQIAIIKKDPELLNQIKEKLLKIIRG